MILNLVTPNDPILHNPVEEFDPKSIDLEKVVAECLLLCIIIRE